MCSLTRHVPGSESPRRCLMVHSNSREGGDSRRLDKHEHVIKARGVAGGVAALVLQLVVGVE